MQVTIPDKDPLIGQLEEQAVRRGLAPNRKLARKRLARLGRALISERLRDLRERGDPLALNWKSAPSAHGAREETHFER